jgi:hypothetical protein
MSLVNRKPTQKEIKMMGIVGPDFIEAKRIRCGRKALSRLQRICQEVNVQVDIPLNAVNLLRMEELGHVRSEISKMTPDEVLNNLTRFLVFTRE